MNFKEIREKALQHGLTSYLEGLSNGTRLTMQLIIGENRSELVDQDHFDRMKFTGEVPDELRSWIDHALIKADEEAAERA